MRIALKLVGLLVATYLLVQGCRVRMRYCASHDDACWYQPPAPCVSSHEENTVSIDPSSGIPSVDTDDVCDEYGPLPPPVKGIF
jgi:hypothetical protein